MSTLLFDYLVPLIGADQAAYWAHILVIAPV